MALQQIDNLVIVGLGRDDRVLKDDVADAIQSIDVSLTMDAVSQVTVRVSDPGFKMLKANYFMLRREVRYGGMIFEISSVETGTGSAVEEVTFECRNKKTQLLKRDKGQSSFGNISPTQYAAAKAAGVGLSFFGESSAAKGEIVRTRNETSDESTWDVLRRLSSDLKYELFETEGRLFFTSQTFLLNKYGPSPIPVLRYPSKNLETRAAFAVYEPPSCRRSDDNPLDSEATVKVDRLNGKNLRPGMTIKLEGVPTFELTYLVKEVSWMEGVPDPVDVVLQTPHNPNVRAV